MRTSVGDDGIGGEWMSYGSLGISNIETVEGEINGLASEYLVD